jgi:hypothetical protein
MQGPKHKRDKSSPTSDRRRTASLAGQIAGGRGFQGFGQGVELEEELERAAGKCSPAARTKGKAGFQLTAELSGDQLGCTQAAALQRSGG